MTKPRRFALVNNSIGGKACQTPDHTRVSPLLHSAGSQRWLHSTITHEPSRAVPFTWELERTLPVPRPQRGDQNTCALRKRKKRWIMIVQTRGWFSCSAERVRDFRYMEYFARNVEWLGNHLSSVLWSYSEHELKTKQALNSGRYSKIM